MSIQKSLLMSLSVPMSLSVIMSLRIYLQLQCGHHTHVSQMSSNFRRIFFFRLNFVVLSADNSSPEKKQVHFKNPEVKEQRTYPANPEQQEREEWLSRFILWAIFFTCLFMLVVISSVLYCKLSPYSYQCSTWRVSCRRYYNKLLFYIYYYTTPSNY